MKVLVLGTLGDLVKKIVELELSDASRKQAIRVSTYHKVLDKWPVTDRRQLDLSILRFKGLSVKLQSLETTVTNTDITDFYVKNTAKRYFDTLKDLRAEINDINNLSVPLLDPMEIEVDE